MPRADIEADRARIQRLARKAKLDPDTIVGAARVALELVPRSLGRKPTSTPSWELLAGATSRFGGQPDFPEGDDEWPATMMFLLTLNLGEIARDVEAELGLPRMGMLNFFVLDREDEDGDYLGTGLAQHDTAFETVWRLPVPTDQEIRVTPCFGVDFVPRLTLPCPGTSEHKALRLRGAAADAYNDVVYLGMPRLGHQLLGHKNTDLDDNPDEVLLLSLRSDPRLQWKWGDGNRLNFHIRKRHLAKGKLHEAYPAYIDA
jgi:hypothetical protein